MSFLSIPSKKTAETNLVKPIEHYIKGYYSSGEAKKCREGLETLQRLRTEIMNSLDNATENTLSSIIKYSDLLESLEQRIPLTNQDIPIAFKWYDCFASSSRIFKGSMKSYNAGFDRICMLFNLAAVHSQIAKKQNLHDEQGLKNAVKSFQTAASLFEQVDLMFPSFYTQSPTEDMAKNSLKAYSAIMLAQAQECCFIKAKRDEMKPEIIAKLAAYAEGLYVEAANKSALPYLPKDWVQILSKNASLLKVDAEIYAAKSASEAQAHGEAISRYNKVLALLKKMSKSDHTKHLTDKITRARDAEKRDNDLIYHDVVPNPDSLAQIEGIAVTKKIPVTFPLGGKPPKDVFKDLIPIAVVSALTVSEGVRQQLVSTELGRLREATDVCNSIMASLNLPAAVQDTDSESLPSPLLEKASKIRDDGGITTLRQKIENISDGSTRNKEILDDIELNINEEEKTDNDLRQQYGEKWNRIQSTKLNQPWRDEIAKHKALLQQATQTDDGLKQRFNENEISFNQLSSSPSELKSIIQASIKSCSSPTSNGPQGREALLALCNQVQEMKMERQELGKELEKMELPQNLKNEFLMCYSKGERIDALAISTDQINLILETFREAVRENINRQEQLMKDIISSHEAAFGKNKVPKNVNVVNQLMMATEAYEQLSHDFQQGITFYADLTNILLKFQNKVKDFSFARKTEKKELMKDIAKDMSNPTPEAEVPVRPLPTYMAQTPAVNAPSAPMCPPTTSSAFPPPANPIVGQMSGPMMYPPGYWPGYGQFQPGAPPVSQMPQMPMYGLYGGYSMPMYPMPTQSGHPPHPPHS